MAVTGLHPPTGGNVAPGFEGVGDEFVRNFRRRGELGAACTVFVGGEKVVDLWGGYRDRARSKPWEEDTLVIVYSTSKGLAAATLALAHSRKFLVYDERVSNYWPEFAENGKERITVRELLAHQAGLCAIDERLDPTVLADLDAVAAAIARQRPAWEPGTRHGNFGLIAIGFRLCQFDFKLALSDAHRIAVLAHLIDQRADIRIIAFDVGARQRINQRF